MTPLHRTPSLLDVPSRRTFVRALSFVGASTLGGPVAQAVARPPGLPGGALGDWFPRQDPAVVQEVVALSHSNFDRVRALVERQPALARSAVDWGFGDWETALGAASHTGRREIAELLLANGAPPTLFSAAMLGQLDVVKAFVLARPGIQKTYGPHGITLLAHARAGGAGAGAVADYLQALGDADVRLKTEPLSAADRDAVVGRYGFGQGERDYFEVDVQNDQLGVERPGAVRRFLIHTGDLTFFPSGVPTVRIAFARQDGKVRRLTIADPEVVLTAERQ